RRSRRLLRGHRRIILTRQILSRLFLSGQTVARRACLPVQDGIAFHLERRFSTREKRLPMAMTTSPERASGIASPEDWQAPPSAEAFQPAPVAGGSKRFRRIRRIAWNLLPPLTFVGMIALWWGAVVLFKIPAYLLPGPGAVFSRLVTDAGMLWT